MKIKKIRIYGKSHASNYDVFIGQNVLDDIDPQQINIIKPYRKILIISDRIVWSLYKPKITHAFAKFKNLNIDTFEFIIPNGEQSKNLSLVNDIYRFLAEHYFSKADYIVAIGGGVVGDICGFVAATYMRGINLINIATTLMAQVDSSIGGKNAINLTTHGTPQHIICKNLIGTFYNPQIVICDIEFLKTLDNRQISSGIAEVIKYYIISQNNFLRKLLHNFQQDIVCLENVVLECIKIKKHIIQTDMFDRHERKFLNFGHTIGHCLEAISDSNLLHGEAVGLGMLMITKAAIKNNLSNQTVYQEIFDLLTKFNLPTNVNVDKKEIIKTIMLDKKNSNNFINLVIAQNLISSAKINLDNILIYKLKKDKTKQFFN